MKITLKAALVLLIFALGITSSLFAQSKLPALQKEKFQLNKEGEQALGYTQAVKVGKTLYISGFATGGDVPTQIKNVYEGLGKVLENYGLGYEHVVKENLYTTNMEEFKKFLELRKAFFKEDYPAATWLEVKGLYDPSLKLEVEFIAVSP